jgi:hypothetical protein
MHRNTTAVYMDFCHILQDARTFLKCNLKPKSDELLVVQKKNTAHLDFLQLPDFLHTLFHPPQFGEVSFELAPKPSKSAGHQLISHQGSHFFLLVDQPLDVPIWPEVAMSVFVALQKELFYHFQVGQGFLQAGTLLLGGLGSGYESPSAWRTPWQNRLLPFEMQLGSHHAYTQGHKVCHEDPCELDPYWGKPSLVRLLHVSPGTGPPTRVLP